MELLRLIKMCLNETYNRVRVVKHLYEVFRIKNVLTQWDALLPLSSTLLYSLSLGEFK